MYINSNDKVIDDFKRKNNLDMWKPLTASQNYQLEEWKEERSKAALAHLKLERQEYLDSLKLA